MGSEVLISNHQNITNAAMTSSSIKPVVSTSSRVTNSRDGNGQVALIGAYTGFEDAVIDIEIDSENVLTPQISEITRVTSGSGDISAVSADAGVVAETITISLRSLGTDQKAAQVELLGVVIQANVSVGNGICINVDNSGLVFTDSTFALIDQIQQGGAEYIGNQFSFSAFPLDDDNCINVDTQRLAFEGYPQIFRQYSQFINNETVYTFTPAPAYNIPVDTKIQTVTGSRTVTVFIGNTSEIYTNIVTIYDFLAALDSSSLVKVVGVIADDCTPGGDGVVDLDLQTDSYFLPIDVRGSGFVTNLDNLSVSPTSPTQTIEIECTNNDSVGAEIWKVKGSSDGDLSNAITNIDYIESSVKFKIPKKLITESIATITSEQIFANRDIGAILPTLCINQLTELPKAVSKKITFTYTERPPEECEPCDQNAGQPPSGSCSGLNTEVEAVNDLEYQRRARLWQEALELFIDNNVDIGFTPTLTTMGIQSDNDDIRLANDSYSILINALNEIFTNTEATPEYPFWTLALDVVKGTTIDGGNLHIYMSDGVGTTAGALPVFDATENSITVDAGGFNWIEVGFSPLKNIDDMHADIAADLANLQISTNVPNPSWSANTIYVANDAIDNALNTYTAKVEPSALPRRIENTAYSVNDLAYIGPNGYGQEYMIICTTAGTSTTTALVDEWAANTRYIDNQVINQADGTEQTARVNEEGYLQRPSSSVVVAGDFVYAVFLSKNYILKCTVGGATSNVNDDTVFFDNGFSINNLPLADELLSDNAATWEIFGININGVYVSAVESSAVQPVFSTTGSVVVDQVALSWLNTGSNSVESLKEALIVDVDYASSPQTEKPLANQNLNDGTVVWGFSGKNVDGVYAPGIKSAASSPTFTAFGGGFTDDSTGLKWLDVGVSADGFEKPYEETLVATQTQIDTYIGKYQAMADNVLLSAGLPIRPKTNASNRISGNDCWSDPGDGFFWQPDLGFLPAFNNKKYYSAKLDADRVPYSTQEFYFHLDVSEECEGSFIVGDKFTISLDGAKKTYQISDRFRIPIVFATDFKLAGGQLGDDTHTWGVNGSLSGNLTQYSVINGAELDYNLHNLHWIITRGLVPFELGDKFILSVEGGTFKWRINAGIYTTLVPILTNPILLANGLSAQFTRGANPSFLVSDSWTFNIEQPYALSHLLSPTRETHKGNGVGIIIIRDFGATQIVDCFAIKHFMDSSATILIEGGIDGSAWPESQILTYNDNIIAHILSTAWNVRYIRLTIGVAVDVEISWFYAGGFFSSKCPQDMSLNYNYLMNNAEITSNYVNDGLGADINYSLDYSDFIQLLSIIQHSKRNNNLPIAFIPNLNAPEEATVVKIGNDVDTVVDFRRFGLADKTKRVYDLPITLTPELI